MTFDVTSYDAAGKVIECCEWEADDLRDALSSVASELPPHAASVRIEPTEE